jgi:OOP family OmpA-OmpF porin
MNEQNSPAISDLAKLRRLLVKPEQEKIEEIRQRLESREDFVEQVGEVLPLAMQHSARQGSQLSQAMVPTVEEIVKLSINRDINRFADALFPVIGPAIRKSIAESMRQMLQSMNQMLESSLSVQGLKWRWEAVRSGVSFAQIVMLHSLVYRVEQVFLIHRQTGLLLHHVTHDNQHNRDPDLVSSMLGAIGDFVGDSFTTESDPGLDSIEFGELSLWIKHAPGTFLAVAIRGDAPQQLRTTMQQTLEQIELQFAAPLEHFDGDTRQFEATGPYLETCLKARYMPREKKNSLKTRLVWILITLLLSFWLVASWHDHSIRQDYIEMLEAEPGYVITGHSLDNGKLVMQGLRDPLARDPSYLVTLSQLDPDSVDHQLEPYQSLDRQFVHRRLLQIIQPPDSVSLRVVGDSLQVSGYASEEWIRAFETRIPLIQGIGPVESRLKPGGVDLAQLEPPTTVELEFDELSGMLRASGLASERWKTQARQAVAGMLLVKDYDDSSVEVLPDLEDFSAPATVTMALQGRGLTVRGEADSDWIARLTQWVARYPAIDKLDTAHLRNSDQLYLQQASERLRQLVVLFEQAEAITLSEEATILEAAGIAQQIVTYSRKLGLAPMIVVKGHTDSLGRFQDNLVLSQKRAQFVAQHLFNNGVEPQVVEARGLSSPVAREISPEERRFNRRVSFDVVMQENKDD